MEITRADRGNYHQVSFNRGSVSMGTLEFGRSEGQPPAEEITARRRLATQRAPARAASGFACAGGDSLTTPPVVNSWNTVSVTGTLVAQNQQMTVTYNLYTGN